jgi:hypothetical protein
MVLGRQVDLLFKVVELVHSAPSNRLQPVEFEIIRSRFLNRTGVVGPRVAVWLSAHHVEFSNVLHGTLLACKVGWRLDQRSECMCMLRALPLWHM